MDYAKKLLAWFDINKREMPWRNTSDPYAIWVSEIMLQQTQVDTVMPYYITFMDRFPTISSLASATLEEVHTYWQGLGYYRRAENLHKGAQMVEKEYSGVFPMDITLVKKIPGIGPYTLGAVLSIAFHMPIPAVDGNVIRILARHFLIENDISEAKSRKVFEEKVMALMPSDPNRFNQGLMELGALVCTPRDPNCKECPVQDSCEAYGTSSIANYPVKSKKVKITEVNYKVLIIKKEDEIWMEKRPKEGLLANLWGFPMLDDIKWEEFKKIKFDFELGAEIIHIFTHRKWHMTPVIIEWSEQGNELLQQYMKCDNKAEFVELKKTQNIPIATAFKKLIKTLKV